MTAERDLLAGFAEWRINTGAEIFLRIAGSSRRCCCCYPQTHVCWHKIAAALARQCALVLADLSGYGAGSVPPDQGGHLGITARGGAQ
jgi:haloacetate dehalogenase